MKKIIVILGPTAVGKTAISVKLAKELDGEIINADSTQVYKNLDIATAKIKDVEKENIPHHLFDFKEINENYTVYDYQKDARLKIAEVLAKNKTPILVGGTGLYIKSALYDYQFKEENGNYNGEVSYEKLLEINPQTKIHPNNQRRIERTLVKYANNEEVNKTDKKLYDFVIIGLTIDRKTLYERINKRTDIMFEEGLLEEAKKYYKLNYKSIMTPIGYKELFKYFDNEITLEEAKELIKKNCRHYAKRQYTFFNNQLEVNWFNVCLEDIDKTVNEIMSFLENLSLK
jgi:tRNA dimethylallyltransferase